MADVRTGDWFAALAYRIAWKVVRALPESSAYAIFRVLANLAWHRKSRGIRQLEKNLQRVVPQLSESEIRSLSKRAMQSYLRYWCDSFRIPDWSPECIIGTVSTINENYLRDALALGKGCVVALPHAGNWDHAGSWACLTGTPLTTVAERLRPESLFQSFVKYRESLGMEVLPSDGAHVVGVLAARLRAGRLVALVADRDLASSGVTHDFFGEPAVFPAGPAALAVQTGSKIVPAYVSYLEPGHPSGFNIEVEFFPPITDPETGSRTARIESMVGDCVAAFEKGIAAHPADWHMLQRFWLSDREKGR